MRVRASVWVNAPAERVIATFADYARWPDVFSTIDRIAGVERVGGDVLIRVAHREGEVRNLLTLMPPDRIVLREWKRRYDAVFVNRFVPHPGRTRYTVTATIRLKGWARLLRPVLGPYVRVLIRRLTLLPVRRAVQEGTARAQGR